MNEKHGYQRLAAFVIVVAMFASPVLAATDAERLADLERKAASLEAEIAALRVERDKAPPATEPSASEEIRAEVVREALHRQPCEPLHAENGSMKS